MGRYTTRKDTREAKAETLRRKGERARKYASSPAWA